MMNGRHLPAGQQGMPPDMGRRRQYNPNPNPQFQQGVPMGYGYMNPYHAAYYPPQQLPPHYHSAAVPYQYGPYPPPPPHVRSPPPMQHYAHPPIPQHHPYPRSQPSPAMAAPYQPPPPPPPPQTPPSTHSSHTVPGPMTPPTPQTTLSVPPSSPPPEVPRTPFRAPLPWLSRPDLPWPVRKARRRRKQAAQLSAEPVELPVIQQGAGVETEESATPDTPVPHPETPSTSHPASERAESTNPTTPSSVQQPSLPAPGETTPVAPQSSHRSTLPAVPVIPAVPKTVSKDASKPVSEKAPEEPKPQQTPAPEAEQDGEKAPASAKSGTEEPKVVSPPPNAWTTPKLWTGLFNPDNATASTAPNGARAAMPPSFGKSNAESLAEALRSYSPTANDSKVAFLEPRGLVNTGNMCYMNSVLQVLVFCTPFYKFLDQVGKRAAYSFKSDTPLLDAMIMFIREYPIIDSATSVEQLRLRLKDGELEQYGEPFTPDFVYDVIKRLPRFVTMQRGHQQDAEEFLGFLLDGLHEECVHVMRTSSANSASDMANLIDVPTSPVSDAASVVGSASGKENGWLEVGPKQKQAVTRSSGIVTTNSPVTKIFGGNLRSELRVPGLKDSVTLEHYQPLQLDIGASNVHNIVDALKGLTRSEALHGDFKSPKGPNVTATKQVFIETVPPVLILHLKRFQYDNTGGTQKIWKKVGYPLELEIPKEVFPRQKRSVYAHGGLPKYRLIAVVYHHGKNASGGHYTVDVRRQDGREWIRLDDTVIKRVRSEDVAEGGSEEDPKVLAAALESQRRDSPSSGNVFSAIEDEEAAGDEDGWRQANGSGKKWSNVVNGTPRPKSRSEKSSAKDNKVAYLLFYQRI